MKSKEKTKPRIDGRSTILNEGNATHTRVMGGKKKHVFAGGKVVRL